MVKVVSLCPAPPRHLLAYRLVAGYVRITLLPCLLILHILTLPVPSYH